MLPDTNCSMFYFAMFNWWHFAYIRTTEGMMGVVVGASKLYKIICAAHCANLCSVSGDYHLYLVYTLQHLISWRRRFPPKMPDVQQYSSWNSLASSK